MIQYKLKEYVYPKRVNWIQIFDDLNANGLSQSKISLLIGVGWSTLQRWKSGTEPKHSVGVSLLTLHTRYCGEDLTNQRITEAK